LKDVIVNHCSCLEAEVPRYVGNLFSLVVWISNRQSVISTAP